MLVDRVKNDTRGGEWQLIKEEIRRQMKQTKPGAYIRFICHLIFLVNYYARKEIHPSQKLQDHHNEL